MPIHADLLVLLKTLLNAAKSNKASLALEKEIEDDKSILLAAVAMDNAEGTLNDMIVAAKKFTIAMTKYTTDVTLAISGHKKEKELKSKMSVFIRDVGSLEGGYAKRIAVLKENQITDTTSQGSKKSSAPERDKSGDEKALKLGLAYLQERREEHLKAAEEVLKKTTLGYNQLEKLLSVTQELYLSLMEHVTSGKENEAKNALSLITLNIERSEALAKKLKETYDKDLDRAFMHERSLGFSNFDKKFGMHESLEKEFIKRSLPISKIFTKATNIGKSAVSMLERASPILNELLKIKKKSIVAMDNIDNLQNFIAEDLLGDGQTSGGVIKTALGVYKNAINSLASKQKRLDDGISYVKDPKGVGKNVLDPRGELEGQIEPTETMIANVGVKKTDALKVIQNAKAGVPPNLREDKKIRGTLDVYQLQFDKLEKLHDFYAQNLRDTLKIVVNLLREKK